MGRPSAAVRDYLSAELDRLGLKQRLGEALFSPVNWHQSLSDRFEDDPKVIDQLLRAGSMISARAVRFRIDRIESRLGPDGVHWEFKPERTPSDFAALVQNVGSVVSLATRRKQGGHSAHLTISYWATEHLPRMVSIRPIEWVLNEVLLVRGSGSGSRYHYDVVEGGRWNLLAPQEEAVNKQMSLL